MMRLGTSLVMLTTALPLPLHATELTPPACYWDSYSEETETLSNRRGANSWPNGFTMEIVSYGQNDVNWKPAFGAEINECSTGRFLVIDTNGSSESDDVREKLYNFLEREQNSTNTLNQVRDLARSVGYSATMFTDDEERCGCAAFYPELRGDKTPFDADRYYGETE